MRTNSKRQIIISASERGEKFCLKYSFFLFIVFQVTFGLEFLTNSKPGNQGMQERRGWGAYGKREKRGKALLDIFTHRQMKKI